MVGITIKITIKSSDKTKLLFQESRKPLPIATVQFGDPRVPGAPSFVPSSGLDFLYGVPSIHIEQTFELYESMSDIASFSHCVVKMLKLLNR